jgi:hypothetical protein
MVEAVVASPVHPDYARIAVNQRTVSEDPKSSQLDFFAAAPHGHAGAAGHLQHLYQSAEAPHPFANSRDVFRDFHELSLAGILAMRWLTTAHVVFGCVSIVPLTLALLNLLKGKF